MEMQLTKHQQQALQNEIESIFTWFCKEKMESEIKGAYILTAKIKMYPDNIALAD